MARRPRLAAGDLAYHVLNRRVGRLSLFDQPADYAAFETTLAEAQTQTGIRIAAYCLMPSLAPPPMAETGWRVIRGPAMDHRHAYATLACPPSYGRDWAGLSRALQVLSGADG